MRVLIYEDLFENNHFWRDLLIIWINHKGLFVNPQRTHHSIELQQVLSSPFLSISLVFSLPFQRRPTLFQLSPLPLRLFFFSISSSRPTHHLQTSSSLSSSSCLSLCWCLWSSVKWVLRTSREAQLELSPKASSWYVNHDHAF